MWINTFTHSPTLWLSSFLPSFFLILHSMQHLVAFTLLFLSIITSHLCNLWAPTPLEETSWINNIFLVQPWKYLPIPVAAVSLLTQRGTRLKLFYGLGLMSSTYLPTFIFTLSPKTCLLPGYLLLTPTLHAGTLVIFLCCQNIIFPTGWSYRYSLAELTTIDNASLCSLRKPYHWLYYHGSQSYLQNLKL